LAVNAHPQAQPAPPPWWQVVLIGRRPKRTLVRIMVLVVACFLLREFALLPIRIVGISMQPTYQDRAINCVNRLAYVFHEPRRGDVVGIRLAGEHVLYLKRIVGLPGETVAFHRGRLLINGQPLSEPYASPCRWELPPVPVKPDEYYVVGDNRSMRAADHYMGKVENWRIVGKILL